MAKDGTVDCKPLNIDHILGNPKNRLTRIGVELEGAWKTLPDGTHLEIDTSVFHNVAPAGHKIGELPLGPMQPAALIKFMKKYYPHKVDPSCGMHVHMSFASLRHYSVLMVPEYQETIVEYLGRWAKEEEFPAKHCIWPRLAGKSEYCQKKFWPDDQVTARKDHDRSRHGHRYTIIHYCGRQHTIECRVLPMTDEYTQAVRGIRRVLDITNACLQVLGKQKEEKYGGMVDLPTGEVYEEYISEQFRP